MDAASAGLQKLYSEISTLDNDFRNINLYEMVCGFLHGNNLLDIGSGPGHFMQYVVKQGFSVTGVEPDIELIKIGQQLYKHADIEVICDTAESYTSSSKYCNITLIDVLEHIKDDQEVLCNLQAMLEPSGRIIIVVPAHPVLYGIRDRSIGHHRRYSKKQLNYLLKECDLRIITMRYWNAIGFLPYFIQEKIFKKPLRNTFRELKQKKGISHLVSRFLFAYFRLIENRFSFGFGLSLICVVEPITKE